MDEMEIKDLIEKKGRFSKEEIAFVIAEGAKVGVMPPEKTNCVNCWRDMAIEVAYAQRKSEQPKAARRFRDGSRAERHGVTFKGRLITNDNIEDLWDWMQANGFPNNLLEDAEG